jgi:hypothetical protein
MDIAFIRQKDQFVVIYLDEIIVFSRSNKEHCYNSKESFLEMPEVSYFIKSQEIFVHHDGAKVVRPYSINRRSERLIPTE